MSGVSHAIKIRDIDRIREIQLDIENDPIIRDEMVTPDCLLACKFDNFLVPALVAAHKENNLDLGIENEGYKSD